MKNTAPYSSTVAEVVEEHGVNPELGLTSAEVEVRRTRFGANTLKAHPSANPFWVLLKQFMSPVVYLLLAAAGFALFLGELVEFTAIMAVLLINASIGFITELRAVRSMEALRELVTRSVVVRRNGRTTTIPAEQLVPSDIVIIDAGDVVAADMRVISSANLASDESTLTGESLPVAKDVEPVPDDTLLADRTCMLFKGCTITRGTGEAIVTGTGMNTELGRISKLVEQSAPERSPLERQLEGLSRHLIWITLLVAAAVGITGILANHDVAMMVKSSVALAVAAIPEGLPVVATLALARGMLRMARYNALIERLSAVETLGSTTVIMTDKTGTLTENRMHADRVVTGDGELTFDRNKGLFLLEGHNVSGTSNENLRNVLVHACLCNNASLGASGEANSGDPMEISLLEMAMADGIERATLLKSYPEVAEHAFDVATRMMATVHKDGDVFRIAVKGAPEAVLDCVTRVSSGNRSVSFDRPQQSIGLEFVKSWQRKDCDCWQSPGKQRPKQIHNHMQT
ncbi:MAG: HAD-IC family P-type ATPase [Fimbriimonadaceae bacterium]|nr:HAD-IC family P-type ATPase [Alphaproteobacteria bacterium]